MKSYFNILALTLTIGTIGLFPDIVSAQNLANTAQCTGTDCSACNLVYLANAIIQWLIGILFVIFAVLMAIAGWGLVVSGGNQTALDAAKSKFTNAIIGFLIILSAWLVIDTIIRGLVGSDGMIQGTASGSLFWAEIECQNQSETSRPGPTNINLGEIEVVGGFDENGFISAGGQHDATGNRVIDLGTNCGIDESTLVSIPGQGSHRATRDVVNRFVSMQRSFAAQGISLNVTSSYRSDARQTQLWDDCPRCQTERTVARPCSRGGNGSAHSSGLALDLSSSGSRSDVVSACRAAGAGFTMTYERSGHVHCDWR